MNREDLAAHIYAINCFHGGLVCVESFQKADAFLAYAAQERERQMHREPKAQDCEHVWCQSPNEYCIKCGAPKVKPEPPKPCPNEGKRLCSHRPEDHEPPKPERKAREFTLAIGDNGQIICVQSSYLIVTKDKPRSIEYIMVREVLPEGDT